MKGMKFAVTCAFLLSVAAVAGSGYLYQRYQVERDIRSELETQQVQIEARSASLESQVTQYQREVERLREQLKGYVDQREALKTELEEAQSEAGELHKQIEDLETERDELKEQLDLGQVTEKAVVQEATKLPSIPVTPPVLTNPGPVAKTKPTPSAVAPSAPPEKAVKPKTSPSPPVSEEVVDQRPDQVLSVNRKFNFVVVNIGLRDRLKIGDTLRIEQNGKLAGKVQVEKLYENFSACTILEEIKPAQIREGDLVRLA